MADIDIQRSQLENDLYQTRMVDNYSGLIESIGAENAAEPSSIEITADEVEHLINNWSQSDRVSEDTKIVLQPLFGPTYMLAVIIQDREFFQELYSTGLMSDTEMQRNAFNLPVGILNGETLTVNRSNNPIISRCSCRLLGKLQEEAQILRNE